MAKRRSEALALGAPFPRFLPFPPPHAPLPKRSRRELEPPWAARWMERGGQKRKRKEGMEPREEEGGGRRSNNDGDREEAAVNGKRPSAAEESPKEKGQGLLGALLKPLPLAGAEEAASPGSPTQEPPEEENEDDVWHYNSFQYWRSPLPTIHLSDILDLENNKAVDERESSSIGMSEMET